MADRNVKGSGWKKHFKTANVSGQMSPLGNSGTASADPGYRNYQSQLPEVYTGHPNRIERYNQYEQMDLDSEVNAALDIIAEFCTQPNIENGTGFDLFFKEDPTDNEVNVLKTQLHQWVSLNKLNKRLFKIVRNTLKYGDQVFLRDPETFELYWTEMNKVTKVIVNEAKGKEPEQYFIKDLNINFQNLTATALNSSDVYNSSPNSGGGAAYTQPSTPYSGGSRFSHGTNEGVIDAEHIVHLSLTEGIDPNWPFGTSILESIFKIFKQKELLEDAILIYRIQRAPERRIFKIDVGNMVPHMAMAFVERIKNEVHQRRIPSQTGSGGANMMDATYNPISTNEDFFFPVTSDGRGSSVDTLPGGSNLGEITDLRFFTNKMFRGLRIPSSYLPTGADDSTSTFNDGKATTAMIQEWRFNQYCIRLQNMIAEKLDTEFKMFMAWRGINIDSQLFELRFNEPQNFAKHRQAEVDTVRIASFSQLEQIPYLSKRFLLERYLDLSEEEMARNDTLWAEEHADTETAAETAGLRAVGVSPAGIDSDMSNLEMPGAEGDLGAAPPGAMPGAGDVPAPDAGAGAGL